MPVSVSEARRPGHQQRRQPLKPLLLPVAVARAVAACGALEAGFESELWLPAKSVAPAGGRLQNLRLVVICGWWQLRCGLIAPRGGGGAGYLNVGGHWAGYHKRIM